MQWLWAGFDGGRLQGLLQVPSCVCRLPSPCSFLPVPGFVLFFPKGWAFLWLDGDDAKLGSFRRVSAPKSEGVGAVSDGAVVLEGQQLVLEFTIPMAGCPSVTPWWYRISTPSRNFVIPTPSSQPDPNSGLIRRALMSSE